MSELYSIKQTFKAVLSRPSILDVYAISLAVTYLCQSKCTMCDIWRIKENAKLIENEMSLNEVKEIFNSRYLQNLHYIGLTGGEPCLRKDFVDLFSFFREKYTDAYIGIPTNAIDVTKVLHKLQIISTRYPSSRQGVTISLDGRENTHDKIRGINGNFKKAIKLANEIIVSCPSIELGIGFTILPNNYHDLLSVYEISKNLGIKFGCQFAQSSSAYYNNVQQMQDFAWENHKLEEVNEMIKVISNDYRESMRSMNKPILNHVSFNDTRTFYFEGMVPNMKDPTRRITCYSGTHSFFLDPRGNLYPCIMLDEKMGNVRDSDFDTVWLSDKANTIREHIRQKQCSCWTPCELIHSIARNPQIALSNLARSLIGK